MLKLTEGYRDRPIRFLGFWDFPGWRMKTYGIAYNRSAPCPGLIATAKEITQERLAQTATEQSYGVGFVGIHQGKTVNFIFIDWWADENELHHHVYVSPEEHPDILEYKTSTGLIACVWDLQLICFEKEAWIEDVLKKPDHPDLQGYLAKQLNC